MGANFLLHGLLSSRGIPVTRIPPQKPVEAVGLASAVGFWRSCLINQIAELFRKITMPQPRLMRRHLHSNRQKMLIIAINMAAEQC